MKLNGSDATTPNEFGRSAVITGGALGFTARSNVSETVASLVSVAVTRIEMMSTSEGAGVPLKVRVPGSKLSHAGSGEPSANAAENKRLSPGSMSAKVLAAKVKLNAAFSVAI